jgi:cytidylate kinase
MAGFVITIDGPVAAGKGTVSTLLAQNLHGFHLSTGAMYRALALACIERRVDVTNEKSVLEVLQQVEIDLGSDTVYVDTVEVTSKIRSEEVTEGSSKVAIFKSIREWMVTKQKQIANREVEKGKIVIVEGRDGGTRIFPESLKFFLTATPEERAKRRLEQNKTNQSFEEVLAEVKERDHRDTTREADPLTSTPDVYGYHIIDSTGKTQDETLSQMLGIIRQEKNL